MDSDSLHAEKARVRREVREASAALPESYLRDAGRRIAAAVTALPDWKEARVLMAYAPAGEKIPQPDLILVPCVAAAMDGRRLGHGAGYYDRFLAGRGAKTFCLCFGRLLREDLPAGPEDIRMDAVVTEDGAVLLTEKRS